MRPGPLRVRLFRNEGSLLDISESGALVRLSGPETLEAFREITLILDWQARPVLLRARVVRSVTHRVYLSDARLTRTEHHVGLEFVNLPPVALPALRELIRNEE